jgi:uncharacterized protein
MPDRPLSPPLIDVHTHLAGAGAGGTGCWISPAFRGRITFRLLRLLYGISDEQLDTTADRDWAEMLARLVRESRLDHAVALGFDGVYDGEGRIDRDRSQMIIPPSWVFEVCRRHPELLPGPSVNPFRADAMERIEECVERGAVLIKWLPITQAIDPSSPRLRDFYGVLERAGIPLLIHMGGERTFGTVAPELNDVRLLDAPLRAGVPVICAHSATRILFSREPDQLPRLRDLLRRYPHLRVDNSGLANPGRFAHLPRLAADPLLRDRTLHGSDFPVPSNSVFYPNRLAPSEIWELEHITNPLDRDLEIKTRLGYPAAAAERAAAFLPNLDRWIRPRPRRKTLRA